MFINHHASRLKGGVVQWHPWLQNCPPTRGLRPGTPHCRLHAGFWAAGGCRSIRCNGGAGWAPSRRLTIPVLIGRDFFCRRFTFSQVSAFHPNPPDRQTISYQTIYPCDTACTPHPTFRSTVFPAAARHFFSPQPDPTPRHPKHRSTPLRQALYLGSPPSSASFRASHIPSATLDTDTNTFCPATCNPGYTSTSTPLHFLVAFSTSGPYSESASYY